MSLAPLAVSASVTAAAAVGIAAWQLVKPRRALRTRFGPYAEATRVRVGGPPDSREGAALLGEAARRLLGPLARSALGGVIGWLGVTPTSDLDLRLRRAGFGASREEFSRRHLRWLLGAPVGLGALGALLGSGPLAFAFFVAGLFAGSRRMPDLLRRRTAARDARIRSDLPTISAILSPKVENRKSLMTAVAEVAQLGSGPVIDDLRRALNLVGAGYGDAAAFGLVAAEASDETAARFYRFLAAACQGGIDLPKALLDHADTMRRQRREEVERSAARRQMSMVIPDLVFMAPVLLLFLLSPVPRLLFGGS